MINYQDYEEYFKQFNFSKEEGIKVLDFISTLIELSIQVYNEKQ